MENIYLCDIDGTLSNYKPHRGPYDEHLVHLDKPLPTCKVIRSIFASSNKVIFFSGRTDNCYKATHHWLLMNIGAFELELYMRKSGDNRPDDIVKEELYNTYIRDKYNVIGVFDDRLKVVRMWWKLGLFVFNCNQGNIEF